MQTHRFTWKGYCAFEVQAETRAQAINKAIQDKPQHIPVGAALFYGMAGGSNAGAVYIVPAPMRCAFCYDREQGTHGEVKREYLEDWQAMAPLCRLHSQANERAAHAARHTSDIDAGEEATRPPYDC